MNDKQQQRKEDHIGKAAKFFNDIRVIATGLGALSIIFYTAFTYAGDSRYVLISTHDASTYHKDLLRVEVYYATERRKEMRDLVNEIADLEIDAENAPDDGALRGIRKKLIRKKAQLRNLKEN